MRTAKLYILLLALPLLCSTHASAQMVDSTAYVSILSKLQQTDRAGKVTIKQDKAINQMLDDHAFVNQHNQSMQGWRVRIYRDNNQTARQRSDGVMSEFKERYPAVNAYRSFENLYFTVCVGDFRTADEATKFLNQLRTDYAGSYGATAWVVKTEIQFPPL